MTQSAPPGATDPTAAGPDPTVSSQAEGPDLSWVGAVLGGGAAGDALPTAPLAYAQAAEALARAGRADDADKVMAAAVRRFPGDMALGVAHARAAEQRKDWPAALERWAQLRTAFPRLPDSYLRAVAILRRELRRPAEAEPVLEAALAMFPDRQDVWIDHAVLAAERHDRPEAIRRFAQICARFPAARDAYRWRANLLRDEGRFDEADAVLTEGLQRFPDFAELLLDRAWVSHSRRDGAETVLRWEIARAAFPDAVGPYWMAGAMLRHIGEPVEADALLTLGAEKFPQHAELGMEHAGLPETTGDWPEAVRRWEALARRLPEHPGVASRLAQARRSAAAGEGATPTAA